MAAALVLIAAFLLWGPIGLGNGPLNMGMGIGVGGQALPGQQRVAFIIPAENSSRSPAVVDSVHFIGSEQFPRPRLISLWAITFTQCNQWPIPAQAGPPALGHDCGGHALGRLIGHGFGYDRSGTGAMGVAEAAVPSPTECWVITKVVVHYHVGIRHYAATDQFGYYYCGARVQSALMQAAQQASAG